MKEELPKRVANVIDDGFVKRVLVTLKKSGRLNLKANEANPYGLVIYPKQIKTPPTSHLRVQWFNIIIYNSLPGVNKTVLRN